MAEIDGLPDTSSCVMVIFFLMIKGSSIYLYVFFCLRKNQIGVDGVLETNLAIMLETNLAIMQIMEWVGGSACICLLRK